MGDEDLAVVIAELAGSTQWDSCAPVAIALAAGFDAPRLNGDPPVDGGARTSLLDLVVSHAAVTPDPREALAVRPHAADLGAMVPHAA
ncbi:MAG: hypothetical protein ACXWUR_12400 [Allosphingosinicella sp.]